jgi:basic membrane protein A
MKKNLFVVLLLAMVFVLSACGTTPDEEPATDAFKVAIIMPSAINDLAFSQSMFDALLAVQEEMGGESAMEIVYGYCTWFAVRIIFTGNCS